MVEPFQFVMPSAQLHPYLKAAVADLDKHGFCILDKEFVLERGIVTAAQLEMFREACRQVSIEKDRNLVIREIGHLTQDALSYLAERTEASYDDQDLAVLLDRANAPGTVNDDEYAEDDDGHGVIEETGQKIPIKTQ